MLGHCLPAKQKVLAIIFVSVYAAVHVCVCDCADVRMCVWAHCACKP